MIEKYPLHQKVLDLLRTRIHQSYAEGDRFPGDPELVKELGVSQGTVRRALSELVREGLLVRKVPAGTFVTKKDRTVGTLAIVAPYYDSHFLNNWTETLATVSTSKNLNFRLLHIRHREKPETTLGTTDLTDLCGAIFVMVPDEDGGALANVLRSREIPCVSIDEDFGNTPVPRLTMDPDQAVKQVLSHLAHLGHQKISLVANEPLAYTSNSGRLRAFREICPGGLAHDCGTKSWSSSYDAAYSQMEKIMEPGPTALFVLSDAGAWAAAKWLGEKKIRVPADVSIVGWNDDLPSRFITPPLTTLCQPVAAMAGQALAWIREKKTGVDEILFPGELIIRESTAPAPKNTI